MSLHIIISQGSKKSSLLITLSVKTHSLYCLLVVRCSRECRTIQY